MYTNPFSASKQAERTTNISGHTIILPVRAPGLYTFEADATRMARDWSSPAKGLAAFGAPRDEEICVVFSDDVLVLLSLVSEADVLDESGWKERRKTVREALRRSGKLRPPPG